MWMLVVRRHTPVSLFWPLMTGCHSWCVLGWFCWGGSVYLKGFYYHLLKYNKHIFPIDPTFPPQLRQKLKTIVLLVDSIKITKTHLNKYWKIVHTLTVISLDDCFSEYVLMWKKTVSMRGRLLWYTDTTCPSAEGRPKSLLSYRLGII
jgi:hypothetical protein